MSLVFSIGRSNKAGLTSSLDDSIVLKGERKRTVILVHGLTGTPNEVRHLAFTLNKAGYSVICPRLEKHGQPLEILKRATWEEFYRPLREVVLEALRTEDSVSVAGLSMSALFVLLLAEEFGDKLAGGICLAPTLFFDGWNVPWYNVLLPLAYYTPLKYCLYFKESPPYGLKNAKLRAMVHRYYSKASIENTQNISKYGYAYFPVSLFYQLRRLAKTIVPILRQIKSPILLIHPKEDDTASLKNSELIYDRISSRNKKLVILYDSYHVITADQERDKVAEAIKTFLNEI